MSVKHEHSVHCPEILKKYINIYNEMVELSGSYFISFDGAVVSVFDS